MRLDSVSLALPARRLSNEDVVALIGRQSQRSFSGNLEKTLDKIRLLLRQSGAEWRYWLDGEERPIDLISRAVDEALARSACAKEDIDLLISAGVDRGFLEPANAYFVADALGMRRVECFDVLDACNGWSRAVQIVDALLRRGAYRRALVINAEFPMFEGGAIYPALFRLQSEEELAWSFAGYTMGEGAAASVLSPDAGNPWEFHGASRPHLADRCSVPLPGYQRYCRASERVGRNGVNRFTSFSGEMLPAAVEEMDVLFRQLTVPAEEIRAIFPHAATRKGWDQGAEALHVRDRLYHVYPRCGNLVSASIPAGIAMAAGEGRIRRGDRLVTCAASAGMAFSVCSFIY
jgi:3-oxoacyl-[acyl-carrier-protein] synthase III